MPDPIVLERLHLILKRGAVIAERVRNAEDEKTFFKRQNATLIVDSLVTRLQALSDPPKRYINLVLLFFRGNIPLDTTLIIPFRDLASHHYELLDYAAFLWIYKTKVPLVVDAVPTCLGNEGVV